MGVHSRMKLYYHSTRQSFKMAKAASSRNPITGEMEYYLGIGVQPCLSQKELEEQRNDLCVVFVIDVSGSMAKAYDYLKDSGKTTKLDVAKELVTMLGSDMLNQMEFSIVTYRASHDSKALTS